MLNWIDKNEPMPTRSDANCVDHVYGLDKNGVRTIMFQNVRDSIITHWLPFHEMPIPKRWRVPTIHDLAKAGKPIPCRVRDKLESKWLDSVVHAISVANEYPFYAGTTQWKYCEIEE